MVFIGIIFIRRNMPLYFFKVSRLPWIDCPILRKLKCFHENHFSKHKNIPIFEHLTENTLCLPEPNNMSCCLTHTTNSVLKMVNAGKRTHTHREQRV